MMRKIKKITLLMMTALLTLVLCTGCYNWWYGIPDYDYSALEVVGEAELEWEYNEEYSQYEVSVKGVAKNVSGEELESAGVTYLIYDEDGNNIGSAYGYISLLEKDGSWRFCATGSTKFVPASVRLHEICGWKDRGSVFSLG